MGNTRRNVSIFLILFFLLLISQSTSFEYSLSYIPEKCAASQQVNCVQSITSSDNSSCKNSMVDKFLSLYLANGKSMTISLPSFTSTINSISFDGSTTIFINDVEGRNKIDITLRNYTMLWENDYIDNDKIRVNILFHYEKNVNYYFLGTPHVNEIDCFVD